LKFFWKRFYEKGGHTMPRQIRFTGLVFALFLLICTLPLAGQQKPQWMPGQMGLNAGILPAPGISYVNMAINYRSSRFNGQNGNALLTGANITNGKYSVWVDENIFYYVPPLKIFGGNLGFMIVLTPASGNLQADILPNLTSVTASAGGSGLADLFIQPFTLGWHAKRVDFLIADAIMAPTGRYSPGATNNIGTGYVGNHLQTGTTYYVTKNRGTSANLFTDWEVHGTRQGTNNTSKTPGEAFTMEWGVGQILPLKKNFSQLLQLGIIGYDQWQVTANGGTVPVPASNLTVNANLIPSYSVFAIGGQVSYILPAKNFAAFFKYDSEYRASAHFQGTTIVFGATYTFRIPKPAPPKP
jgi:hypothetical protein